MKLQKLPVFGAVAVLLAVSVCITGCKRKRSGSPAPSGSEPPVGETSGTPATAPVTSAATGGQGSPATHPGEAMDPPGLKLARDLFERKMQRPPNDWQEMIDAKVIPAVPKRKDGQPLNFSEYTEFYIHRGGQTGKR